MTTDERARAYLDAHPDHASYCDDFDSLPDDVAERVAQLKFEQERQEDEAVFVPENARGSWEDLSPSGKYRLVVTDYISEGYGYTRGVVFRKEGDGWVELPQDIKRNFHSFFHSWVEGHANGHDYLVGGIDYQGQTVLELDTGKRRDFVPKEASLGFGFCWAEHRYHPESQLLMVGGCYWACPYEQRLYDFSSPMHGWPEVELFDAEGKKTFAELDNQMPEIQGDVIKLFQTKLREGEESELRAVTTYRRDGHKLLFQDEWVSPAEQARRVESAANEARFEAWLAQLKASDPLYLEMRRLCEGLPAEDHISIGWVHDRWCSEYQNPKERTIHRRVVATKELQVNLEWGTDQGPVKVSSCHEGEERDTTRWFMDHSVESMQRAFAYVRELMA